MQERFQMFEQNLQKVQDNIIGTDLITNIKARDNNERTICLINKKNSSSF